MFGNELDYVHVLSENFVLVDRIRTGLAGIRLSEVSDVAMCFSADPRLVSDSRTNEKNHPLVVCLSKPTSIRLITKTRIIWKLDDPGNFLPCSVSASVTGDIYVVDRKEDRVSKI